MKRAFVLSRDSGHHQTALATHWGAATSMKESCAQHFSLNHRCYVPVAVYLDGAFQLVDAVQQLLLHPLVLPRHIPGNVQRPYDREGTVVWINGRELNNDPARKKSKANFF